MSLIDIGLFRKAYIAAGNQNVSESMRDGLPSTVRSPLLSAFHATTQQNDFLQVHFRSHRRFHFKNLLVFVSSIFFFSHRGLLEVLFEVEVKKHAENRCTLI
jgi:hypothetical protein